MQRHRGNAILGSNWTTMPLLDAKYEIISERALSSDRTLFEATAPDGEAVHIVWYELGPEQEGRFEEYRRAVKRLKRAERAAVYDVVSRPGAHYVAWRPAADARPAAPDAELSALLEDLGFDPGSADVRRDQRRLKVYGLAFGNSGVTDTQDYPPSRPARPEPVRRLKPAPWLLTALATLLLVAAAAGFLQAGLALRSNDRLLVIPPLSGEEINAAARRLHQMGFAVETVPLASDRPAGTVLKSEPDAGNQLRPGRLVRLSYALPPGSVTPTEVPRVVARRYPEEAEETLSEHGLKLGSVSRIPAEQAGGLVISQSPPAGTVVGEGSEIDLLVSAGPSASMTFLPDLTGMPLAEARYLARLAGLRPERIIEDEVPAARGQDGTVVAQSLRPNQPVVRDEAVLRLIVARAEGTESNAGGFPSLVGLTLDEARARAGRVELTIDEISDRALPEGVVDQTPSAGTPGPEEVTLVVNVHPVPVPRPDVIARVRQPEPRELQYRWLIEPGIPEQQARVYAVTLDGRTVLVRRTTVRGGQILAGTWRTQELGPVRFQLTLNDQPYGGEQQAN